MIALKSSHRLALVGILIIVLNSGCDLFFDLTTVAFQPAPTTERDVDLDGGPDLDTDLDTSLDTDAAPDVIPDTREEPDTGPELIEEPDALDASDIVEPPLYCPFDYGNFQGVCDPVAESGCPQGGHCSLGFSGGIVVTCTGLTTAGSLNEGDPCAFPIEDNCQRGLYCLNWAGADGRHVCSKFCFLSTNEGCSEDQFCTYHFDSLDDVGFCVDRCDPYAPDACAEGSICAPDPNYIRSTPWTCHPDFRCLRNDAPTEPIEYKSTCNIPTLHQNGCPEGQTCSLTNSGQRCVMPCQADEDCTSLGEGFTCGEPESVFELRYCDQGD